VPCEPVSVDAEKGFVRLYELNPVPNINDESFPKGWVNFYRVDDYTAVSYFYLNKTSSSLSSIQTADFRLKGY